MPVHQNIKTSEVSDLLTWFLALACAPLFNRVAIMIVWPSFAVHISAVQP